MPAGRVCDDASAGSRRGMGLPSETWSIGKKQPPIEVDAENRRNISRDRRADVDAEAVAARYGQEDRPAQHREVRLELVRQVIGRISESKFNPRRQIQLVVTDEAGQLDAGTTFGGILRLFLGIQLRVAETQSRTNAATRRSTADETTPDGEAGKQRLAARIGDLAHRGVTEVDADIGAKIFRVSRSTNIDERFSETRCLGHVRCKAERCSARSRHRDRRGAVQQRVSTRFGVGRRPQEILDSRHRFRARRDSGS